MMSLGQMRTRASLILAVVALAQGVLLAAALGFLVVELNRVRRGVEQLGREEQAFLDELGRVERDAYRSSVLLRDYILLGGAEAGRTREELVAALETISGHALHGPAWLPGEQRARLGVAETALREYVARMRTVAGWSEEERKELGGKYLLRHVAPMRENLVAATQEIAGIVRAITASRSEALAGSMGEIQTLILRILSGAAALALVLAAAAIWRFRVYERERDVHTRNLKKAEDGLRALSQRLVESQESERKKLSRELHDEVGQLLTALRVQVGQIEPAGETSAAHLQQAAELADRSLKTVRQMARGLRPAMLDDLGLAPALRWLGRDVSKSTELEVDVQIEGELADVDEPGRTCVYRVVQEALTNCVKHSGASRARVLVHESPHELVLTVQDNGGGFVPGISSGIGLLGMRERVEEAGGRFEIVSSAGAGTLIRASLPRK